MSLEINSITDVMDQVKAANGVKPNLVSGKKERAIPLVKALGSLRPQERDILETMFQKELRSPDLSSIRLVSLYDEVAMYRNESTVFLNIIEGNPVYRATDLQIRYRENHIGTDEPSFFNPNGDFAPEAEMSRNMRDQTVGFHGNQIKIRFLAQALASQSPVDQIDVVQEELSMEMVRMRRFLNSKFLSNTEIKAENVGNIPQWGGILQRSTSYNLATSGDLTNGLIQGRIDAIANATDPEGWGYNVPLIALCPAGQIGKIEDLMIARWPGENSATAKQTMGEMLARVQKAGIAPDQCVAYKPRPGRPILFIYEPQMPAGYCFFFDPADIRPAKFQMMGTFGPWVLERPTADLLQLIYVFDGNSILDGPQNRRALLTGLNS